MTYPCITEKYSSSRLSGIIIKSYKTTCPIDRVNLDGKIDTRYLQKKKNTWQTNITDFVANDVHFLDNHVVGLFLRYALLFVQFRDTGSRFIYLLFVQTC